MTLTHYPISNGLFSEIDRFFQRGYPTTPAAEQYADSCTESCATSDEIGWSIRLELPGFKKEEVSINVDGDYLVVAASTDDDARSFLVNTERRIKISDEVDAANISAKLEDGLLFLEIPKKVKAEPLSVVIN